MEKSAAGVLFPIALGLGMWLFLEVIGAVVRATNRGKREPVAFAVVDTIRLIGIVLTILFAVLAIALPLGPALPPALIGGGTIAGVALATIIGCIKISRATNALRAENPSDKDLEGYPAFTTRTRRTRDSGCRRSSGPDRRSTSRTRGHGR